MALCQDQTNFLMSKSKFSTQLTRTSTKTRIQENASRTFILNWWGWRKQFQQWKVSICISTNKDDCYEINQNNGRPMSISRLSSNSNS